MIIFILLLIFEKKITNNYKQLKDKRIVNYNNYFSHQRLIPCHLTRTNTMPLRYFYFFC